MNLYRILQLTKAIDRSLTRRDSTLDYSRTVEAITLLARSIRDFEGETEEWLYLNEFGLTPEAIIVGAFWHGSQWHGGQCSDTYAMLSACGEVFSPGMTNGPETESCEFEAFEGLRIKCSA